MKPSDVVYLDSYRGKKDQRFRRSLALAGHDPEKIRVLSHLWQILALVGGDRAAVVWLDEYGPELVHAQTLLDLASDRPRRIFSLDPLKGAWETGVPGLLDIPDYPGWKGSRNENVKSSCAVALGSDGPRSWFLVADSLTPRPPLPSKATGELMFLAGELASMVLHKDLIPAPAPGSQQDGQNTGEGGGRLETPFAGWPVLQDIEGRRKDSEASRRIATRFLVARIIRTLVEDHLVMDPESLGYQVNGVREELDAVAEDDGERMAWNRVLAAVELLEQDELLAAILEWGCMVEDMGHLNGALELHALSYELAEAAGAEGPAVDAARFQGRVLRKLARWDEALRWYEIARGVAEEIGNVRKLASVLDGLGNTFRDRGNLPQARKTLRQVMKLGETGQDRYVLAIAHHDLMTVEKLSGDMDGAVVHGWKAVQSYDSQEGSLRALFDLAGVLRESGELSAAQDAYAVVASQVRGKEYRLLALDAMAYISAMTGDEERHSRLRSRLDEEGWEEETPPVYLAQLYYFRGLSARALGEAAEGETWLRKALACAEENGLNKLIFDAERALKEAAGSWTPGGDPALGSRLREPSGKEVLGVRQGLREMRRSLVGVDGPLF